MSKHVLIDLERSIGIGAIYYWKPNKRGYTTDISEAGLYSAEESKEIVNSDFDRLTVSMDAEKAFDLGAAR